MLTVKQAEAVVIHHPTRAKKVRVLVEMDATDFPAFLLLAEIEAVEVAQHTIDHINRCTTTEGAA